MHPSTPPKESRSRKHLWLLLGAFLVGLLPPLFGMFRMQGELKRSREELQIVRQDLGLARVRALAGQVYLETSRNNFGTAAQIATELFVQAQQLANSLSDDRRQKIQYVLDRRGKLTSDLAAANTQARATAEDILAMLQPAATSPAANLR